MTSSHASATSAVVSHNNATSQPNSDGESEATDDLQDLIDSVLYDPDDCDTRLSEASSFEGDASTAQEALAIASALHSKSLRDGITGPLHTGENFERTSLDSARSSLEGTERPSFESARTSSERDSARTSMDPDRIGIPRYSYSGMASNEERPAYHIHKRRTSSMDGGSNRSSLRDYLSMERPTVG